jgi:hypothetical protein
LKACDDLALHFVIAILKHLGRKIGLGNIAESALYDAGKI